ncbi:hypothetical protein QAD02_023075 [Eretmocerus hayati]|uniref:Uncharacterized protein n=1 Tax=Eretmocerus hayati TaxID=131215 RepID=A0ACC2PWY5_9HYME|nr:hypothetical protein QAD02_023075 [Eretmocerus hayati]
MSFPNGFCLDTDGIPKNDPKWWESFVNDDYPNTKCLTYFKCSRKTYMYLIDQLRPHVASKIGLTELDDSIYLRKGICVDKQVAVVLQKLTTCADYVSISRKFDIHKTTVHKIIYKCILALNKHLLHDIIKMPNNMEARGIAQDFKFGYGIPMITGAMSITHIPISSPIHLNYQFLNSKLYPSFILQAVIDSNCLFRDVSVKHAGAAKPNVVLTDSNLYKYSTKVLPQEKQNVDGFDVPYKILGPEKGPPCSWLLTDYNPVHSSDEALFNKSATDIRNYSESVITRLRSRFLILSHAMDLSYKVAPQVIAACCIIHNICETHGDPCLEEWLIQSMNNTKRFPQPEMEGEFKETNKQSLRERDIIKNCVKSSFLNEGNISHT